MAGKQLGKGAYGSVQLAAHNKTGVFVAIKQVDKAFVQQVGKVKHVIREKELLFELQHPNIISLYATF